MTSIQTSSSRRTDISVYPNGRIDITARIARQLHLADGDVIDIGSERGEYYLYIRYTSNNVVGRHAGVVHATRVNNNNFRTYAKSITSALYAITGVLDVSPMRCACGAPEIMPDDTVRIPIITRAL